jgi:hypothetical protein
MRKIRTIWMSMQVYVFNLFGMKDRIQKFYLEQESVKQKTGRKLKWIMRHNIIPYNRRVAAIRLYELGLKNIALDFLINQINLYKKPKTTRRTICETCVNTAIALGRLKDSRALFPLLEALGALPYFGASYALSLLNGKNTIVELQKLSSLETEKGIHALVALGYMGQESALQSLIKIYENKTDYDEKFRGSFASSGLSYYVYKILGLYNEENAEKIFLSNLNDSFIDIFLMDYVHHEMFPHAYMVGNAGWLITRKYGWDKYIDTDGARFTCLSVFLTSWDNYFKTNCPFKTQEEVDSLKKDIRRKVWRELPKCSVNHGLLISRSRHLILEST